VTTKHRPTRDQAVTDVLVALTGLLHLLMIVGAVLALVGAVPFLRWALGA